MFHRSCIDDVQYMGCLWPDTSPILQLLLLYVIILKYIIIKIPINKIDNITTKYNNYMLGLGLGLGLRNNP